MDKPPPINKPEFVPEAHAYWGTDAAAFWRDLAEECKKQEPHDAVPTDSLTELSKKLEATPPKLKLWDPEPIALPDDADLWIIGDIHGDLLSYRALTHFATKASQTDKRQAHFCFLGDFFDDGPFSHAVLFEILSDAVKPNPKVNFVAGNHDLALGWDAAQNRFTGDVIPHDFADWLNERGPESPWRDFAKAAIRWFESTPRALVLGDGTLIAHGGCVHADRLSLLSESDGLENPEVLEDLVWLRAHDTAKRKIPNRNGRGCQFGVEDLADFLTKISEVTKRNIFRVIRGHDHVLDRWSAPPHHEGRLLTLNAMCWRQRDPMGPFLRHPVIARYRPPTSLDLFQLEIPEEHVVKLYGQQQTEPCAIPAK